MPSSEAQRLAYAAVGAALVAIATMFVQIPMPAGQGYANVGDAAIFLLAALFGPVVGLAAGGIGSALADVLTGYAVWAPFTLVIKGLEGWIAGRLAYEAFRSRGLSPQVFAGFAVAALWMMAGYFVAGAVLAGSFAAAAAGIPLNLFQAVGGIAAGSALLYALRPVLKGVTQSNGGPKVG
ncbi:MAG TPA: ECF transporter S component [Limnochordales bacterium]